MSSFALIRVNPRQSAVAQDKSVSSVKIGVKPSPSHQASPKSPHPSLYRVIYQRTATCAIIHSMKLLSNLRIFETRPEEDDPANSVKTLPFPEEPEDEESALIKTVGWVSAGLGAVALGLFIGREIRQRYKFNRRTPYDFYSHAGDENDVEVGLGI